MAHPFPESAAKPPLGVMPRKFWLFERARDLSIAISAQLSQGAEGRIDFSLLIGWVNELRDVLREMEREF